MTCGAWLGWLGGDAGSAPIQRHVQLTIGTDGDLLAFKPDQLSCPSGAAVHLIFHHNGKYITQQHNWVLTVPGAADAVAAAGIDAGEKWGFVPQHDARVLAATPPCGKGQEVSVDFIAPAPRERIRSCARIPGTER